MKTEVYPYGTPGKRYSPQLVTQQEVFLLKRVEGWWLNALPNNDRQKISVTSLFLDVDRDGFPASSTPYLLSALDTHW